jgi:glutathione S-transferase
VTGNSYNHTVKLYDAGPCPFCARARIALQFKEIAYEAIEVDLRDRPTWIYDLNVTGRVPVLDDGGYILPESAVIMEYLDERYPDRPLLPADARDRAAARLLVHRFDDLLARDWYAFRKGESHSVEQRLEELPVGQSLFADIAFSPWVIRARDLHGFRLPERLEQWLSDLASHPAFAAEIALVRSL